MSEESISLEEKVSKTISKRIGRQLQLSEIDLAKMEYGLAVLLVISSKIFFIWVSSYYSAGFNYPFGIYTNEKNNKKFPCKR